MLPHRHVLARSSTMAEQHELSRISATPAPARTMLDNDDDGHLTTTSRLHKRTLLKLDCLLLPFLALLFLFNSLDKSNVSSARLQAASAMLIGGVDRQCRVCTFHHRHWTQEGRPQHRRSPLFCFLRHAPARWRCPGTEIWHGCVGADMHAPVGTEHNAARLGEAEVAVIRVEDRDRVFGRYAHTLLVVCSIRHAWLLTMDSRLLPRHRILPLPLLYSLRVRSPSLALLRPSSCRRRARRHYQLLRVQALPRPTRRQPRCQVEVAVVAGLVSARGQSDSPGRPGRLPVASAQRGDSLVPHA